MSPITTIGILYPGSMGASLAQLLHTANPSLTLLSDLTGRSPETLIRAKEAGLENASLEEISRKADLVFSILPPSAAVELATQIAGFSSTEEVGGGRKQIYIDANAVAPSTISTIAGILRPKGWVVLDGCVIGGPYNSKTGYKPTVYLSSDAEDVGALKVAGEALAVGVEGWKVSVMDGKGKEAGGGLGAASALKMCYGGIGKGAAGLAALLVIAAQAHSSSTADALIRELSLSQPDRLRGLTSSLPSLVPKAYRWVGEMEEISKFISETLGPRGKEPAEKVAGTYTGLAEVFQRIADDLKIAAAANGEGNDPRGREVDDMLEWAEKGKEVLQK